MGASVVAPGCCGGKSALRRVQDRALSFKTTNIFYFANLGKKPAIRRPWTPEECAAIKRQLRRFLIMNITPGKADCEKCLSAEPKALKNRDWKAVKYFVKNRSYELRKK
ncbi:hypothetical protein N1851_023856 [Merluccius polli]|uniref:Uncharacterized protein n=1 Tax=Merluccius polli TaxID=89951 RepID=A0AA47MG34_MERPO|nr:hypothetical protein N1851_023856 [Merluccius polli]